MKEYRTLLAYYQDVIVNHRNEKRALRRVNLRFSDTFRANLIGLQILYPSN